MLVVVNALNSQQPQRLYRYLRALGTPFFAVYSAGRAGCARRADAGVRTGKGLGEFLTALFDIWVREDIGRVYVQLFDATLGVWCGFPSQMCALGETCGHAFALEADGSLYQCDHYVYPAYRLGNIRDTPLKILNESAAAHAFAQHKKTARSRACDACPALRFCYGDCPKHRLASGKSALCSGYRAFFEHAAPCMKVMRDLLKQRRSPVELMLMLRP